MTDSENNFEQVLAAIVDSADTDDKKIAAINDLLANLNPLLHGAEMRRASEAGAVIAQQAKRPEMAAQFCLMRAKAEIGQVSLFIKELKELKMAFDWFEFALEADAKRYKELDSKINSIWANTQALINLGYKLLNQKRLVGAVGYCHEQVGEIYGSYYLQLRLYYYDSGHPWRARIANMKLVRWSGLDDLLLMTGKSRTHLRRVKKDCLKSLRQARRMYKRVKAYSYLVGIYFSLTLEHHTFNDPVRSKLYLWWGRVVMKWHRLNDPWLERSFGSVRELPWLGGDKNPLDELVTPEE